MVMCTSLGAMVVILAINPLCTTPNSILTAPLPDPAEERGAARPRCRYHEATLPPSPPMVLGTSLGVRPLAVLFDPLGTTPNSILTALLPDPAEERGALQARSFQQHVPLIPPSLPMVMCMLLGVIMLAIKT